MKKIIFLIAAVFATITGLAQHQIINNGETGLVVLNKLNTMFGELYDNVVNMQFSADGSTGWHDTYSNGDAYFRISRDVGNTWSDAIPIVATDLDKLVTDTLIINGDTIISVNAFGMQSTIYDPAGIEEQLVGLTATQTLTNKTLSSPTISNFVNANHNHSTTNQGGVINSDYITEGTNNLFSQWEEASGNIWRSTGYVGIDGVPTVPLDVFGTTRTQNLTITNSFNLDGQTLTDFVTGSSDNTLMVTKGYVDDAITAGSGYNDESAQDAVGTILDNTGATGDIIFAYDDATPKISGTVEDDSHNHTATTISGLSAADFASANISQWTNDENYIDNTEAVGGDLTGTIASAQVSDDSHNHVISNVDGLTDSLSAHRTELNALSKITFTDGLKIGGYVVWDSGLTFDVSTAEYYISGTGYATSETTVTLDAADATNPRIDVIAVDTTESVVVIKGTAAASPSKPFVNPQSQIELTQVLLLAGDTVPYTVGGDSITGVTVYDENVEWTGSATGVTVDFASTTFANSGTVSADVGTIGNYDLVGFSDGVNHSISDYTTLSFYIKLKETMPSQHALRVDLLDDGVITGLGGTVKLNKSSTAWQLVSVPFTDFTKNGTTFDQVRFWYVSQNTSQTITGFYLDEVKLQEGLKQPVTVDLSNYWSKEEITEDDTTRWGAGITALTGDVTASGSGSVPATLADDSVKYANLSPNLTDSVVNNTLTWDISGKPLIYCSPSTGTVSFTNPQKNKSITVILTLSSSTITWPSTAKILDGSATLGDGTFYVYIHCISDTIYTVSITKEAT